MSKISRIAVYNIKGGVGKTRIALNIALTWDYGVVTNDIYSVAELVLPTRSKIMRLDDKLPEYSPNVPIIYDLGGHADQRAIEALRQSQFVLTPVLPDKGDTQLNLDFLVELQEYNDNIILIVNDTRPGQFEKVNKIFNAIYPRFPVFEIKHSRAMSLVVEQKISVRELARRNQLHRRFYEQVDKQFEAIINYMKNTSKQGKQ